MAIEAFTEKVLDGNKLSEDWLVLLEDAQMFNRYDLGKITALLAAPCELGTIVLRDQQHSYSEDSSLKTLDTFFRTHRFLDYSLTKRCFSAIKEVSSYKVPFVNWHYTLFPLENPTNCHWLNPLDIYDLKTIQGHCYAELTNGLILKLPTQMRSIIDQSEKAIYSLCLLRREYSIALQHSERPLEYLQMPNTPFLRSLQSRPLLQRWMTDPGAFQRRYLTEALLDQKKKA